MHDEVRAEIDAAIAAAIDQSAFYGGPQVAAFEQEFAAYCGARHCVALASGTDALELGLRALGVGPGDLVVTTPHTFMATVEAMVQLGADPRFVDIDPTSYNIDPGQLCRYLTEQCQRASDGSLRERASGRRIAALIPVHLYGLPAPMPELLGAAAEWDLPVLEDACQAHGASLRLADGRWAGAGTMGQAGCFSFYPAKNLGALGEAGALVTDDAQLAERVRVLHNHGQRERYVHVSAEGVNARMDAIQAAVLAIKLRRLTEWNDRRREVAAWYRAELAGCSIAPPLEPESARHVYHLYVVRVEEREAVREQLDRCGVATGVHYPIPLHLQPALTHLGLGPGSFPETERAAREVLSLPMYPHMERGQVEHVVAALREAVG